MLLRLNRMVCGGERERSNLHLFVIAYFFHTLINTQPVDASKIKELQEALAASKNELLEAAAKNELLEAAAAGVDVWDKRSHSNGSRSASMLNNLLSLSPSNFYYRATESIQEQNKKILQVEASQVHAHRAHGKG